MSTFYTRFPDATNYILKSKSHMEGIFVGLIEYFSESDSLIKFNKTSGSRHGLPPSEYWW